MRRALWVSALVVAALALLPEAAWACPVCFDPRDENRLAFIGTAAFLTFLPLGMIAGAGLWLRHRYKDADADVHGAHEVDPAPPAGD